MVEVACSAAACFGLDKIRSVAVNVEAHVASVEPDDGVWLRGHVFHEHFRFLDCFSGGRGLFGAYVVERDKHSGVDSACNVKEGSGNILNACDAAFIKVWCG